MRKSFIFIIPLFIIFLLFLNMERASAFLYVPSAPADPSGVNAFAFCYGDYNPYVYISWTDNSDNEGGFSVYRGTTSGFIPDSGNKLSLTTGNRYSYLDWSLPYPSVPGTTYYYKISSGNPSYASSPPVIIPDCRFSEFSIYSPSFDFRPFYTNINVGGTGQLDGRYDSDGFYGPNPEITPDRSSISWSSLDSGIASVNSTGLVTGVGIGSTVINGTYLGRTAEYAVNIRGASPPNAPNMVGGAGICIASNNPAMSISWNDISDNETGFAIYRFYGSSLSALGLGMSKVNYFGWGVPDSFSLIAMVGANTTNYTDTTALPEIRYLYKIKAINGSGSSAYMSHFSDAWTYDCEPMFWFLPAPSIDVGSTYQFDGVYSAFNPFIPPSTPQVTPPRSDIGWYIFDSTRASIDATGLVTAVGPPISTTMIAVYGGKSSTNSITVVAPHLAVGKDGTGIGTITSIPAGINCGADCDEFYTNDTVVTLTAAPSPGSTFDGWSGDADCLDGSVTLDNNIQIGCIATFNLPTYTLSVTKSGTGTGTVTSVPAGINCDLANTDCTEDYADGTPVTLTATPAAGSTFAGWSGNADCSDGNVTMNASKTCDAKFDKFTLDPPSFSCNTATYIPDLNLSWQAVSGASSYAVYFKGYKNDLFTGNEMTDGKFSTVSTSLNTPYLEVGPNVYSMFSSLNSLAMTSPSQAGLMGLVIKAFDNASNIIAISSEQKIFIRSPDNQVLGQIVSPPAVPTANCFLVRAVLGGNTFAPDYPPANGAVWWEGSVDYSITHLNTGIVYIGNSVNKVITIPNTFNDVAERFTIQYNSGGPPGVALARITAVFTAGGNFESGQILDTSYNSTGVWAGGFNLHFANTYTLSVTNPGANGRITSTDGFISCGNGAVACSRTYSSGTAVTLNTTPAAGYTNGNWGGDCGAGSNAVACGLTMNAAKSVSASFIQAGTIYVNATLDGIAWTGSVNYQITGPETIDGTAVDATFSNKPIGNYTLDSNTVSGGPAGAIVYSITPAESLPLGAGSSITFTINFASPPNLPANLTAPNWSYAQASQFGALKAFLKWQFSDPNPGSSESAYQLIVDDDPDPASPLIDTGKCLGYQNPAVSCLIDIGVDSYPVHSQISLTYNTKYYWWVKVWNNYDLASGLKQYDTVPDTDNDDGDPLTFTTYKHEFPLVDFSWTPTEPSQGEKVKFTDASKYYTGASPSTPTNCNMANCDYLWTVPADATIDNASAKNPQITFGSAGQQSVTLKVTDDDGYYSSLTKTLNLKQGLPSWREVKPK